MNSTSIMGDRAQGYMLRNASTSIKQDIQKYSAELTSGQTSDVRKTLAGNYSFLTDVERKVTVLGTYEIATSEAAQFTGAMQLALGNFGELAQGLSSALLSAGSSASGADALDVVGEARATLDGLVNTLNTRFAGRSLFAGNATDQAPLLDTATILTDLTAAIAGAATPEDMMTAATAWFDAPAGFVASAYRGSGDPLSAFAVSPNENVALDVRADNPGLIRALRGAAVAALATDPGFALSKTDQSALFTLTGQDMLIGRDDVVALQSDVGFAQARIDTISVRNAAEVTSLNLARNTLLEADPFETATKLEEVQFQLQSLYSVTVRMSQLSLVNYL